MGRDSTIECVLVLNIFCGPAMITNAMSTEFNGKLFLRSDPPPDDKLLLVGQIHCEIQKAGFLPESPIVSLDRNVLKLQ